MATLQVDRILECEGLACPLPVVRTKKTRSDMACQILSEKGFKSVKNVVPGMSEWKHDVEQD
ncbi:hypothetical protein [Paenibacillus gyeongsangnamensis]|uniref:hypothetical protein n=1 Tax=Paenibacillus gyeongsangnamensis TaxID=3388067 RepID=UPI003907F8EC